MTQGKPIVGFRRKIIGQCKPYKVNKKSYLKPGSRITQSGTENELFDNMFEMELTEHYEKNYKFRNILRREGETRNH